MIIPDGFASVTIPHTHSALSRSAVVTFGVELDASFNPSSAADANQILTKWSLRWDTTIATEVTYGPVSMLIGTPSGENIALNGTTTDTGANTTEKAGPPMCARVTKLSLTPGRRGKGRMFIPWILNESDVNEVGRVDGTVAANWAIAMALFQTDIQGLAMYDDMVILHSESGPDVENPSSVPAPSPITGWVGGLIVGSQRRRRG